MSIQVPNYTQFPNVYADNHMHKMTGGCAKVFVAMCRKIIGFHKERGDKISYSQLKKLTGLNEGALNIAIKDLEAAGLIGVQRVAGRTSHYKILFDDELTSAKTAEIPLRKPQRYLCENRRHKRYS